MKTCELCKLPARAHCESDEASLCWNCDASVHGANFLVARHSRTLLCQLCQSATPWKASGSKLGHTISVCERCVNGEVRRDDGEENEVLNGEEIQTEGETEIEDDEQKEEEEKEKEEGENQVVQWSTIITPKSAATPANSDESVISRFSIKGMTPNASDLPSQEDVYGSSPEQKYGSPSTSRGTRRKPDGEVSSTDSTRPLKSRRTEQDPDIEAHKSICGKSATSIDTVNRAHQRDKRNVNQTIKEIDLNTMPSDSW